MFKGETILFILLLNENYGASYLLCNAFACAQAPKGSVYQREFPNGNSDKNNTAFVL